MSLEQQLRRHVQVLAGEIGERNLDRYRQLQAAAEYIVAEFEQAGYEVARQAYPVLGRKCENLAVEIPGSGPTQQIVVVGAHYDSVPGCPAANDNGSGVAALLELAKMFRQAAARRALRFVAFVNEEPPYFHTEAMGSLVYARACRQRGERITAALSLETIGFYSDAPRSQTYPPGVPRWLYPSQGNFIAVVGNLRSRGLVRQVVRGFRRARAGVRAIGAAVPSVITGAAWSDHWSFWEAGYPAVMITDTAPFRYRHYHLPSDTPDKLCYPQMTAVVEGLQGAIRWVSR